MVVGQRLARRGRHVRLTPSTAPTLPALAPAHGGHSYARERSTMTDSRNSQDLENYNGVALFVRGADGRSYPVGPEHPIPTTGGGNDEAPTQPYAPQILGVGLGQALTVPAGATHALIRVVTGRARMGLVDASVAPESGPGGGMDDLHGAELLTAFRVDVLSGQVRVDYWRVG